MHLRLFTSIMRHIFAWSVPGSSKTPSSSKSCLSEDDGQINKKRTSSLFDTLFLFCLIMWGDLLSSLHSCETARYMPCIFIYWVIEVEPQVSYGAHWWWPSTLVLQECFAFQGKTGLFRAHTIWYFMELGSYSVILCLTFCVIGYIEGYLRNN